jgi:hypothetical protein
MSGVTAITGRLGKAVVSGVLVLRLTEWRLNHSVSVAAWGDSDSGGFTNRKAGRIDGTGTIMGKFDSGRKPYAIFRTGDVITLALWNTTTAGDYWAFPSAIVERFDYTVSPDTQDPIGWTADFGADGTFYYPGETGAPTYTLPSS